MKTPLFLLGLLLCGWHVYPQTIRGRVQNDDNQPVPWANVLLLNPADSSLVKGDVSDTTGHYVLKQVPAGQYLLLATSVGYEQAYSPSLTIRASQLEVLAPTFILRESTQQLGEVAVVATRPFVEQLTDRMVINVANSIVASGGTGLDVLEKAPGVVVDRQNGRVSLLGKDGVIIQIDGRPTNLTVEDVVQMLSATSSDNIEKIELISNPSARYDAAGNAGIINVVMKKNENIGTNASLSLTGGSGRFDRTRGGVSANHRVRKFNLFGNYSVNHGGNYSDYHIYRSQADGDQRNIIDQRIYMKVRGTGQNSKAGLDYFLSENTTLGLVWTGFWHDETIRNPDASTTFRRTETGPVYLETTSEVDMYERASNQVVNVHLQQTIGKNGELNADVDWGTFRKTMRSAIRTQTLRPPPNNPEAMDNIVTFLPIDIDILAFKLDYRMALGERWNLEAGIKRSSVDNNNHLTLLSGSDGNVTLDPNLSNQFRYTERVNAGYLATSGKPFEQTELQLGLRAEQTSSVGHSITLNQKIDRDYLNFFPSFLVKQGISDHQELTLSYSYRIDRPNYQNLNPVRWYLDPYSYGLGNPFLQPQYTHSIELKHGFQQQYFTSLGFSRINDYVFYIIEPADHQESYRTPRNIGTAQILNLNISFPVTVTPFWELQANLLGIYSHTSYEFLGVPQEVRQTSGRLNLSNALLLGDEWRAEVSGWLNTPTVDAIMQIPWRGSLDLGLQRGFGQKWKVKLSVQDLFRTNQWGGYIQGPGFWQDFNVRWDTRVVLLNLTYTFGNQDLKGPRQRQTSSEEEMQRAH